MTKKLHITRGLTHLMTILTMRITIIIVFSLMIIGCNQTKKTNNEAKTNPCDENFYSFNWSFIIDKSFQTSRSKIENWNYVNMYSDKDYTLEIIEQGHEVLDESEKDLVTEKHLTYFQLNDSLVTDYLFKKNGCKWFLVEKNILPLNKYKGKEFIQFLKGISTDTSFLKTHTNYPLKNEYFGDNFTKQVKFITKEEENILDFFGKGYILFLNSGNISQMKEFYIALRGTGNGMNSTYYFKEVNGTWVLTEFSDFST